MKKNQIITAIESFIAAILAIYISDYLTDVLELSAKMNFWFSILLGGLIAGHFTTYLPKYLRYIRAIY